MSYTAYKFSQHSTTDTRDVEYRLLAQVTARLLSLKERTLDSLESKRDMIEAALWNRDIWSALRSDLSNESNQLPIQLRGSLISIAMWVERECMQIVDGRGDIEAIIEVNRNIMAGLKPHQDQSDHSDDSSTNGSGSNNGSGYVPNESFIAAI